MTSAILSLKIQFYRLPSILLLFCIKGWVVMHYDMLSLLQVLFAFLHDYTVLDQLLHINLTPLKAYIPGIVHDTYF